MLNQKAIHSILELLRNAQLLIVFLSVSLFFLSGFEPLGKLAPTGETLPRWMAGSFHPKLKT
jgi:hypothetical protein